MVLLTVTPAAKAAMDEYRRLIDGAKKADNTLSAESINNTAVGNPIEHHEIVKVSQYLTQKGGESADATKQWRLDALLKGASIYQPPPPPKTEHVRHIIAKTMCLTTNAN